MCSQIPVLKPAHGCIPGRNETREWPASKKKFDRDKAVYGHLKRFQDKFKTFRMVLWKGKSLVKVSNFDDNLVLQKKNLVIHSS